VDLEKLIEDIKEIRIQGAKEIAIEALKFLKNMEVNSEFFKIAERIKSVRPTAVVLHNAIEILKASPSKETLNTLLSFLQKNSEMIYSSAKEIAENVSFKNKRIMTYCHSSEAISAIKYLVDAGYVEEVYVGKTEPKLQGLKTARELRDYGVEVTVMCDNARAWFLKECDCVIVGSDAMRVNGNVNKIGTFSLSLAARYFKKPFIVVASLIKLDYRKEFRIEERDRREVIEGNSDLKVRNPAFDVTPWELVDFVLSEDRLRTPGEIIELLLSKSIDDIFKELILITWRGELKG